MDFACGDMIGPGGGFCLGGHDQFSWACERCDGAIGYDKSEIPIQNTDELLGICWTLCCVKIICQRLGGVVPQ